MSQPKSKRRITDEAIELLGEVAEDVQGSVHARWEEFRARSVYFQLKALVLAVYVGLVVATVVFVPIGGSAANDLGARIVVLDGDFIVGRYFVIHNESRMHWRNVTITVDDGFAVERDLVQAGDKLTLYAQDFKKTVVRKRRGREIPKLMSLPIERELSTITVRADEGSATGEILPLGADQERTR